MSRLLAMLAFLLMGCAAKSDHGALSRLPALEVVPPAFLVADLPEGESRRLAGLLESALDRSLQTRGYAVASGGSGAALLRSTWVRDAAESAIRGEPVLAISFSVFDAAGRRLLTARSVRGLPARAWTEDRVNAEVGQLMRGFPERRP